MASVAAISAKLTMDNRQFDKGARAAGKSLDKLEKKSKDTSKGLGTIGKAAAAMGAAFAASKAVAFLGSVVSAASDFEESINAVEVATGDASAQIMELGEGAATSMGMSKTAVNEAAVAFSAFGEKISAGSGQGLGDVFEEYSMRATDFASVMNLDVDDAMQKFQSGLAGEAEALRKFGIDMSAVAVETYAYANGIGTVGVALSEGEKVQARYALLMQQTDKFAGDFANTSDGLANSQRILAAEWENAKVTLGDTLLPIMTKFTQLAISGIQQLDEFVASFQRGFLTIKKYAGGLSAAENASLGFLEISRAIAEKLEAGGKATNVAADAMAHLAKNGQLSAGSMKSVQAATGLSNMEMALSAQLVVDNAAAFGVATEAAANLEIGLERLKQLTLIDLVPDNGVVMLGGAADAVVTIVETMVGRTETELKEAADDWAKWEKELIASQEEVEAGLRDSMGSIIDLFAGAPRKIRTSVNQMIANIKAQRQMAVEFETNMRTLMAAGLGALVEELEAAGPAAVDQAAELAADIEKAFVIEGELRTINGLEASDPRWAVILEQLKILGMTFAEAVEAGWSLLNLQAPTIPGTRTPVGGKTGGGIPVAHGGGMIGGTAGTDEVLMKLQKGEGVIDRETMRQGFSGGGGTSVVVNVAGSVTSERDLVTAIRDGLTQLERRNGTSGL